MSCNPVNCMTSKFSIFSHSPSLISKTFFPNNSTSTISLFSVSHALNSIFFIFHPPILQLLLLQYLKLELNLSFFHFQILFQNLNSIFVFSVCRLPCGFPFVYIQSLPDSICFVLSIPGFLLPDQ